LSGLITSILAFYQHFTGWLVPEAFWQNQNTFRVTAWYGFPNAVGLFLAPLVPLAFFLIKENWNKIKNLIIGNYELGIRKRIVNYFIIIIPLFFIPASLFAIVFAKSTGALVGLITGLGFLLLINKSTRLITCLVGLVGIVSLVSLPQLSGIKDEILLQDRSGQIRISIWHETARFLKDNPIFGAGLASYTDKIKPYHTTLNGEGIEIFHHPHNIFLTMYVNLGLLGLIGFVAIIISLFLIPCLAGRQAYSLSNQSQNMEHRTWDNISIYLITSLIIILVMGLVDSPYIKNDLSILFWLLPALLIINSSKSHSV
jgi:O-antigen ligase